MVALAVGTSPCPLRNRNVQGSRRECALGRGRVEAVGLLDSHFFIVRWMLTLACRMVVSTVLEHQWLLRNHPQGLAPGLSGLSHFPAPGRALQQKVPFKHRVPGSDLGPSGWPGGRRRSPDSAQASPPVHLWDPQDRKEMCESPVILSCVLWCLRTFPLGGVLKMVCVGAVLSSSHFPSMAVERFVSPLATR